MIARRSGPWFLLATLAGIGAVIGALAPVRHEFESGFSVACGSPLFPVARPIYCGPDLWSQSMLIAVVGATALVCAIVAVALLRRERANG